MLTNNLDFLDVWESQQPYSCFIFSVCCWFFVVVGCRHICGSKTVQETKIKPMFFGFFSLLCCLIASVTSSIMQLLKTMGYRIGRQGDLIVQLILSSCTQFQSMTFSKLLSHCCRDYSELGEAAESTSSVSCSCGGTACPPLTRFHFILLFWNHTLTWVIKRKELLVASTWAV